MLLVTVTREAEAKSPLTMVTGLVETDGVPKVQLAGAVGRVGSLMVQEVPVSNGPTVVEVFPARLAVTSPAPQL